MGLPEVEDWEAQQEKEDEDLELIFKALVQHSSHVFN
jgi:hypothetical protein